MSKGDFLKVAADFAAEVDRRYSRIEAVIAQRDRLQAQWDERGIGSHDDGYLILAMELISLITRLRDAMDCPFPDEHEVDAALDAVEAQLKLLE